MLIVSIYIFSLIFNIYAFYINGLRPLSAHEFLEGATITNSRSLLICDVLTEFKNVYDLTILIYISIGIILPLFLVCYFNLYITRVLFTRKNLMLRHFFYNLQPSGDTNSANLATASREQIKNLTAGEPLIMDIQLVDVNKSTKRNSSAESLKLQQGKLKDR